MRVRPGLAGSLAAVKAFRTYANFVLYVVRLPVAVEKFKILAGLPVYGDLPEQFSTTGMGMHSEGFVVQFFLADNQDSWVGNFQRGLNSFDEVLEHPDAVSVIVVAGGECYIVHVENRKLKDNFGAMFETVIRIPEKNIIIFGTCIDFEAVGASGHIWQSRRISLDGIHSLKLEGDTLTGEAWSFEDIWIPFSLDVNSGEHKGGAKVE